MKSPVTRHPEHDELLRHVDGELPARATGAIREHLEACWNCRVQLQEIEETISLCVGYRKNVLQRHLPPPPAPWFDIYRQLHQIDASTEPDFLPRVAHSRFGVGWKSWAAAAAVLVLISVLFYRFRLTPSVQASELLTRAVAAAGTHAAQPQAKRIQIRTSHRSIIRTSGRTLDAASNSADAAALQSLEAMFAAARYDWDDPLSAKSFQTWRNQLPDKHDEVVQQQDSVRVRTSTTSGNLAAASLELRSTDLTPLDERFEFRNSDWVEITALPQDAPPDATASVPAPVADGSGKTPPKGSVAVVPNSAPATPAAAPATLGDELHVLAALHQVGADLGDPIEVSLSGGKVLVTGIGIAPQRQREINDVLVSQPQTVVRFSDAPPAPAAPGRETPVQSAVSPDIRQLQSRIAENIGGRANFDQLAAEVLDASDALMSRAYALRRLAERFPAGSESQLSALDVQVLNELRREHSAALKQQAAEIDRLVRPVLSAVGSASPAQPENLSSAGPWQTQTENLFQSARHLDKLLAGMFGASQADASIRSGQALAAQLLSNIADMRARSEVYDRSLTPPPKRSDK